MSDTPDSSRPAARPDPRPASGHGYETGRLDLPFTGLVTFAKRPPADWSALADAHCVVLGAPFDAGTQYRSGARFGPRAVREASTLFSFGHAGAYDHEAMGGEGATFLPGSVRIVDGGDADIVHTDTEASHRNIRAGVEAVLAAGALPVLIGGDHSVNIPAIEAYEGHAPFHLVQIDAHLDFVDVRHGVTRGHGNPMKRASEKPWVSGLSQFGIRNVSSTAREGYEDARASGSDILSVRQFRHLGPQAAAARVPEGPVYLSIDIDGFDPSIAPGTGTPSHGGFLYYEVLEFLEAVCAAHEVVGIDLVEVSPDHDTPGAGGGTTGFLAAQLLMNVLGYVFHARGFR